MESVPDGDREALLAIGRRREWSRNEVMIRAGDRADSAIVLLAGVAKVHAHAPDGAEVVLNLCGPGDFLGEITAVRDSRRSATVTALEGVSAIVLTVPQLRSFLAAHPSASLALLDLALKRLHRSDAHRVEFASTDALGRVTRRLIELADRFGEPRPDGTIDVALAINQEDLAAWSASSRESTARALRSLRQLGAIQTHRLRLTILDIERLRSHAARL